MKLFAIIFCVFLSAFEAEISPLKLLSCEAEIVSNNHGFKSDHTECIKNILNITDQVCDRNQIHVDETSEDYLALQSLIAHAAEGALFMCELELSGFGEGYLERIYTDLRLDRHLDCYQVELKRIRPNLDIFKNFNKTVECDRNETLKSLGLGSNNLKKDLYFKIKSPQCSLEEFLQEENFKAFELEKVILVKATNVSYAEIENILKERMKGAFESRLECILNSWK